MKMHCSQCNSQEETGKYCTKCGGELIEERVEKIEIKKKKVKKHKGLSYVIGIAGLVVGMGIVGSILYVQLGTGAKVKGILKVPYQPKFTAYLEKNFSELSTSLQVEVIKKFNEQSVKLEDPIPFIDLFDKNSENKVVKDYVYRLDTQEVEELLEEYLDRVEEIGDEELETFYKILKETNEDVYLENYQVDPYEFMKWANKSLKFSQQVQALEKFERKSFMKMLQVSIKTIEDLEALGDWEKLLLNSQVVSEANKEQIKAYEQVIQEKEVRRATEQLESVQVEKGIATLDEEIKVLERQDFKDYFEVEDFNRKVRKYNELVEQLKVLNHKQKENSMALANAEREKYEVYGLKLAIKPQLIETREWLERGERTWEPQTEVAGMDDVPAPGLVWDFFVIPESSTRLISEWELLHLDQQALRIARNEIFARHGRIFNDEEISTYFEQQQWYRPSILPNDFSEEILNQYEKANIEVIKKLEQNRS